MESAPGVLGREKHKERNGAVRRHIVQRRDSQGSGNKAPLASGHRDGRRHREQHDGGRSGTEFASRQMKDRRRYHHNHETASSP